MSETPRTYIVILNWNGWADTVECLESVFRNDHPDFRVVVCDNDSADGSLDHIAAWAEGREPAPATTSPGIVALTTPPMTKPITYAAYDRAEAEAGGKPDEDPPLTLIQTGANLGFAGGTNVGLRYALARGDADYVWALNNDTVIDPKALVTLIDAMERTPNAGMGGSKLIYYENSDTVQAWGGGHHNTWLCVGGYIGGGRPATESGDAGAVVAQMDYVAGVSMMVSRAFLEDVGLMAEDYFLYYEEIDWAFRMKGRFNFAYAPDSVIYHKHGASIGSNMNPHEKSFTADYFINRNRLRFARRFTPWALPTVYLALGLIALNRLRRGQWDRFGMVLSIMLGLPAPRHKLPK